MITMGNVWDRTTAFLQDRASAMLPIAILLLFVPVALSGIFPLLGAEADPPLRMAYAILGIVAALALLWGQLAATLLAIHPGLHWTDAVRGSLARLPLTIGVFLLLGLAFLVVTLPVLFLAHISPSFRDFGLASQGQMSPAIGWGVVLYAIALLLVMLWVFARLVLLNPVIVNERLGLASVTRAFRMTRGLALRIVGVFVLYLIVVAVAQTAARLVFGSIFRLILGPDGLLAGILTLLVVAVVSTIFYVIAAAFVGRLYVAIGDADEVATNP